jgi:Raf kinase inhibitor-like YbhB/YbcL family protein
MAEHDPYALFRSVPSFTVTSQDLREGEPVPLANRAPGAGGEDVSPQLSWSGFPAETKGFAITCLDPDAPTGSGFWHWAVYNIPASVTSIEAGAGSGSAALPPRSAQLKNELRRRDYAGAEPPEGTGVHRYFFAVHAVDVDHLDLDPESTPAVLSFTLNYHSVGRGFLIPTASYGESL